jgi:hypothetical protein
MRKAFTVLVGVLLAAVVVQFFLAGVAAFASAPNEESFGMHTTLGHLISTYAVLMGILAMPAKMPGRVIGLTFLIAGLGFLQPVIAGVSGAIGDASGSAGPVIFGLHAVNGLVIMGVTGIVFRKARELSGTPVSVATA